MQRSLARFFQMLTVLIGVSAVIFLLWEPQVEGVNANATWFEIYFQDPFLAYVYIGSIPFFVGFVQAFKLLGYLGKKKTLSLEVLNALRTIKYCALALLGFVLMGEVFLMLQESDDRAGGVAMGALAALGSVFVAVIAAKFERDVSTRLLSRNT